MKFKLLYFGDILINPKKRSQHIADIRMQFHPQLKKLVEHQPWNNLTQYMVPTATKSPITTRHVGGIDWNPIITPNLKLLAEIDIQMMHPEIVGVRAVISIIALKHCWTACAAPRTSTRLAKTHHAISAQFTHY